MSYSPPSLEDFFTHIRNSLDPDPTIRIPSSDFLLAFPTTDPDLFVRHCINIFTIADPAKNENVLSLLSPITLQSP